MMEDDHNNDTDNEVVVHEDEEEDINNFDNIEIEEDEIEIVEEIEIEEEEDFDFSEDEDEDEDEEGFNFEEDFIDDENEDVFHDDDDDSSNDSRIQDRYANGDIDPPLGRRRLLPFRWMMQQLMMVVLLYCFVSSIIILATSSSFVVVRRKPPPILPTVVHYCLHLVEDSIMILAILIVPYICFYILFLDDEDYLRTWYIRIYYFCQYHNDDFLIVVLVSYCFLVPVVLLHWFVYKDCMERILEILLFRRCCPSLSLLLEQQQSLQQRILETINEYINSSIDSIVIYLWKQESKYEHCLDENNNDDDFDESNDFDDTKIAIALANNDKPPTFTFTLLDYIDEDFVVVLISCIIVPIFCFYIVDLNRRHQQKYDWEANMNRFLREQLRPLHGIKYSSLEFFVLTWLWCGVVGGFLYCMYVVSFLTSRVKEMGERMEVQYVM